jgi:hypothetical protein
MARSKKKFTAGSYTGKGGHKRSVHGLQPVVRGTSIGAARQKVGKPYDPAPPRGFRPSDAGQTIYG